MIVVVTGGRDHTPTGNELRALLLALYDVQAKTVRHGGARGVDTIVSEHVTLCTAGKIRVERWAAAWDLHGKSAGPLRNRLMLLGPPPADLVIAFPGGRGTANCVAQAEGLGVRVVRVGP
jgi:hypothetical protein